MWDTLAGVVGCKASFGNMFCHYMALPGGSTVFWPQSFHYIFLAHFLSDAESGFVVCKELAWLHMILDKFWWATSCHTELKQAIDVKC